MKFLTGVFLLSLSSSALSDIAWEKFKTEVFVRAVQGKILHKGSPDRRLVISGGSVRHAGQQPPNLARYCFEDACETVRVDLNRINFRDFTITSADDQWPQIALLCVYEEIGERRVDRGIQKQIREDGTGSRYQFYSYSGFYRCEGQDQYGNWIARKDRYNEFWVSEFQDVSKKGRPEW